jgi:hypothetical protein
LEDTFMKGFNLSAKLLVCAAISLGVLIPRQAFAQG